MLRLGIVDFDSSHCVEFTRRLNHVDVDADQCVDGARIVAGCPGTSRMAPLRIDGFREQFLQWGIDLVERPEELIGRIDGVLILSLCGDDHLERVRPFLEAGIPAFVDKPWSCSMDDAAAMLELAEQKQTLLWTSSALRFSAEALAVETQRAIAGEIVGATTYGPAWRADANPGLSHYGIHAVELLFALLGRGCRSVRNTFADDAEIVTARWNDGRLASVRGGRRGATAYGFLAFCEQAVLHTAVSTRYAYRNLCREIVKSFQTNRPAVDPTESLEIVRFIAAALASERDGGREVELA